MDELWRTTSAEDEAEQREQLAIAAAMPFPRKNWLGLGASGAGKTRRKLTGKHGFAQLGFGGCGGMYNYFLGVASVLQVNNALPHPLCTNVMSKKSLTFFYFPAMRT